MVSLWPWKASDNSPASFEKALSNLTIRIAQTTTRLDGHRRRSRRFRALWTLYSIFIYLLYAVIVLLVVGWEQWGAVEYTAVAGGPVLIYAVRAVGDSWYQYRISRTQDTLDDLQKERDKTIEKLKEATRYNSTLKLLEKYGHESPRLPSTPEEGPQGDRQEPKNRQHLKKRDRTSLPSAGQRTGLAPPPTANIRRNLSVSHPSTPRTPPPQERPQTSQGFAALGAPSTPPPPPQPEGPGFHPSAFPPSQQYNQPHSPRWYDRVLDVLLGEDETLPQNRLALICERCRLVNGQAAPGLKTLEEVGRWRCGGCGAWNGVETVAKHGDDGSLQRPAVHSRTRSQSMPHPAHQPAIRVSSPLEGQGSAHGEESRLEGEDSTLASHSSEDESDRATDPNARASSIHDDES